MVEKFNEEWTRDRIKELNELITNPEFTKLVDEAEAKSGNERVDFVNNMIKTLSEKGVSIPENLMISTRNFEEPPGDIEQEIRSSRGDSGSERRPAGYKGWGESPRPPVRIGPITICVGGAVTVGREFMK